MYKSELYRDVRRMERMVSQKMAIDTGAFWKREVAKIMAEYIDREALIKSICHEPNECKEPCGRCITNWLKERG